MTEEVKKEKPAKEAKLVKMVNEEGHEADVHPEEVHNYAKGGYTKKD